MPYSAYWRHDANIRCPNLVPTAEDRTRFKDIAMTATRSLIHAMHSSTPNTKRASHISREARL
jgi:hypothetical protein